MVSINLLKVDVEGHEYKVFEGAAGMIKANAIDVIEKHEQVRTSKSIAIHRNIQESWIA